MSISLHWFRRDLRLEDNPSLNAALASGHDVQCVFVFDVDILSKLHADDARVNFIHERLQDLNEKLKEHDSSLLVLHGTPLTVLDELTSSEDVAEVHTNEDYEPYAIQRDTEVGEMLRERGIAFHRHIDHVIFRPGAVVKDDGKPYTVYTPFKNKWLSHAETHGIPAPAPLAKGSFHRSKYNLPSLSDINFERSPIEVPDFAPQYIDDYHKNRDNPASQETTYAGTHLRFGTHSVRDIVALGRTRNKTYLSELIWREFFIQIMFHFPHVIDGNFRAKYDVVPWRNDEGEFKSWCEGRTGYPMVDAGMRQLNETGYMHNRVRMVTAAFLCKHLLIHWSWGEAYFAEKLLDFELASNNGNWQWAAGTGCDAAPYFRVFNPTTQLKRFDSKYEYVRRWLPELDSFEYPEPIVEHKMARERAIATYKDALAQL